MVDLGPSLNARTGNVFERCDTRIARKLAPVFKSRKSLGRDDEVKTGLLADTWNRPDERLLSVQFVIGLLDFGIAGLLEGNDDATRAVTTLASCYALTPEYAAPEQFARTAAGVGADVYSLGVILYELVTGVLPYTLDRHDLAAAERTVRDHPPEPPT